MATTKWMLDPAHSEIQFKLKHLMITNVTGQFTKFDVTAETEGEDFLTAKVNFRAEAASVDTNNEQRDGHVRSADFFDVEKYPTITFTSTHYKKIDSEYYEVEGNLTIKDITKPVKLQVEFGGTQKDPWGNTKAGFSIKGTINRKDWGLTWNTPLEAGGFLVGDEVKISAEIQLQKQ